MAWSPGEVITADRLNLRTSGVRIGVTENTADSGTFTAETVVMTITVPLVTGRTYSVLVNAALTSNVTGDVLRGQLRENSISGTSLDSTIQFIGSSASITTRKYVTVLQSDYTATATGNKTFVVTGEFLAGTGPVRLEGSTNRKSYIVVRYESG